MTYIFQQNEAVYLKIKFSHQMIYDFPAGKLMRKIVNIGAFRVQDSLKIG